MIRNLASFTSLIIFLYGMCAALPVIAGLAHGNHSAIVAATERN
jgi:hypothetical protein